MFKKLVIPLILAALVLAGCNREEPVSEAKEPVKVRRTVLVYMEGRNNLHSAAISDLNEMRQANIPEDCRLIVYRSISGDDKPVLMEIKQGKDSVMITYPAEAMATDPEQLRTVLADVKRRAPSDELGIVFWSHSSGWRQKAPMLSRGYGLEYSSHQMSITDLASALEGQGLDFIFFDTCYMGCVEVAYELRHAATRMVASVCEVPTDGMPYTQTVPFLFDANTDEGLKNAIDATVDHYTETRATSCPSTLSLIDLTLMQSVADATKAVITNDLPENFQPQSFSISSPYRELFFDLGQYVEALGGNAEEVIGDAVIHERHTPYKVWNILSINHCSGLTTGIPSMNPSLYEKHQYSTLEWAKYMNQ